MLNGKKVIAFVAASGTGSRMNMKMPKQFVSIHNVPLCFYPLFSLQKSERVDEIAIAVPDGWNEYVKCLSEHLDVDKLKYVVNGGPNLPSSMRNMLAEVEKSNSSYVIAMMDGDRIILDDIMEKALDNFQERGITIPYFNPYEAAFYMDKGEQTDLQKMELDRKKIFLVAPPIIYPSEVVVHAMSYAVENGLDGTYLHQLVIKLGYEVSFVKCSNYNIKVTEPGDLEVVGKLIV